MHAKGRKQYRYHPRWRELCDADKYEHLLDFGWALPRVRRAVRHDLARSGFPRERALATVVSLLESTMTLLAATGLAAIERPESDREAKRVIARTIECVAAQLGNTTAVCRRCYVHPTVIDRFLTGDLRAQWSSTKGAPKRDLRAGEHRLLSVLRSPRPRRAAA